MKILKWFAMLPLKLVLLALILASLPIIFVLFPLVGASTWLYKFIYGEEMTELKRDKPRKPKREIDEQGFGVHPPREPQS